MRVLFCTTGGLGHLLPLRPLARALRQRGHDLAWVTAPDALPLLEAEGFDRFAAGPGFEAGRRRFRAAHADAVHLAGEALSAYTFPRLFGDVLAPAMLRGVEQAVRRWCPDLVVHEPAALAAPVVCRQLGLRHVVHGYGLRPSHRYIEQAMRFLRPHAQAHGFRAPADGDPCRDLALDIAPASLEPAVMPEERGVFRFNAQPPAGRAPAALPADLQDVLLRPATRRPRIYVTFGTVFNRSPALFAAVRAAAEVGGTVVVTTGTDGDAGAWAGLGGHVHVHRFVEQAALLPHCDMVVSHGGAGTLLGAAANGIPHLVLPQAADHFRNARAIVAARAGACLEPAQQSPTLVASALSGMLDDGALAVGAKALAEEVAAMPEALDAAAWLEHRSASAAAAASGG